MWWLVTPFVLAIIIGAALVAWLPRQYQTSSTLGVSLPAMSRPGRHRATPAGEPEERLRNINQALTSPAVLERVAREEGLDKTMSLSAAMQKLQSNLKPTLPPADPRLPEGTIDQFIVAYTDDDAAGDAAGHQPAGRRLRRGELAQAVAARRGDVGVHRPPAAGQPGAAERIGRTAAGRQGSISWARCRSRPTPTWRWSPACSSSSRRTANAIRGEQDRLSVHRAPDRGDEDRDGQ